jgi:hypothetical protein
VSRDGSAPSLTRRETGELTAASRFVVIVAERKTISAPACGSARSARHRRRRKLGHVDCVLRLGRHARTTTAAPQSRCLARISSTTPGLWTAVLLIGLPSASFGMPGVRGLCLVVREESRFRRWPI